MQYQPCRHGKNSSDSLYGGVVTVNRRGVFMRRSEENSSKQQTASDQGVKI